MTVLASGTVILRVYLISWGDQIYTQHGQEVSMKKTQAGWDSSAWRLPTEAYPGRGHGGGLHSANQATQLAGWTLVWGGAINVSICIETQLMCQPLCEPLLYIQTWNSCASLSYSIDKGHPIEQVISNSVKICSIASLRVYCDLLSKQHTSGLVLFKLCLTNFDNK